ncbi:MAG: arabinan endo-1,5-alpha-L-arabinosidase [Oscillospiraceae bacterium]|nr:arabinan endo-1,5-alpha-L-arabinosidase [Oscillospiraceae bacterium]
MLLLRLNDYHARSNACAGVHDPSMMWDPVTRNYYSYCTDVYGPSISLEVKIGIPVRSSPDLLHFTYEGTVLSDAAVAQGRDNGAYPPTQSFWAPFVEYVHGEYRMYYSATRAFGSSESRIWLAVAQHPLGPFENRGVVADTWGTDNSLPNAIDPHIIWDGERCYLVYGSFFGGIYLKELSGETGLPLDGDPRSLGRCIARKGAWSGPDGPEGAAVAYVPETGYFYLFLSYGWLGDTYDIRVGRSKQVSGPYLDRQGLDLVERSPGEKLAGSYRFDAAAPNAHDDVPGWHWGGFRGPGHGVPFFDPVRKAWFFVHHVRDGATVNRFTDSFEGRESYRRHYGVIRAMFFRNGWPLFSPEPYTGEDLQPLRVTAEADWELLSFCEDNSQCSSTVRRLSPDDALLRCGVVHACRDFENGKTTLALTGTDELGIAYWGKLRYTEDSIDFSKIVAER